MKPTAAESMTRENCDATAGRWAANGQAREWIKIARIDAPIFLKLFNGARVAQGSRDAGSSLEAEELSEHTEESEQPSQVVASSGRDPAHGGARPRELAELVTEHLEFVWRSLRRFGVREADVDDATQRVFLIANEKLSKIERGREKSFLVGIAVRIASHARRSYKRRDVAELRLSATPQPSYPNPEELTQRLEARELLDRVLEQMPEELRAVFVLFELEELSVDEIARLLALPRGTAATRLRRAREVFHQCAKAVADHGKGVHRG